MNNSKPIQVRIQNYQSIEDVSFEINGFVALIGKTNVGKSAVVRAISGALLNKPVTNLVRYGTKSCSVSLSSENWGLLWEKAEKGLNRYTIEGKAERLENVGQKQPDVVAKMGFCSIKIGDRDLYPWYASQWTPIFLLDEGGPSVTQFISEISGLDVLQNAITLSLKEKKKSLDSHRAATVETERFQAKLNKVEKLDELIEMSSDLEEQAASIEAYETRLVRIAGFLLEIEKLTKSVSSLSPVQNAIVPKDEMGEKLASTLTMYRRWMKLEEAVRSIVALHKKPMPIPTPPQAEHAVWIKMHKYRGVHDLQQSVHDLEPVLGVQIPPTLGSINFEQMKKARATGVHIDQLKKSISILGVDIKYPDNPTSAEEISKLQMVKSVADGMDQTALDIKQLKQQQDCIMKELKQVMEELSKIPSCPTCDRPMVQSHAHS